MSFFEYTKRLFLVRKCASCRAILDYDNFNDALCPECRLAFDIAKTESCAKCFKAAFECTCQPNMLSQSGALCLRKLFIYHTDKSEEPQNKLLYFIKHNPSKRASGFVARELWRGINEELSLLGISDPSSECLISNVPRGRKAVCEYGFDQSEEVCERLSLQSGMPYVSLIKRKFRSKEQKKLNAHQRQRNVKKSLAVNEKNAHLAKGKYIILFDDIVTTGASMSACIPMLRKMGVKGVICCTLATDFNNKTAR